MKINFEELKQEFLKKFTMNCQDCDYVASIEELKLTEDDFNFKLEKAEKEGDMDFFHAQIKGPCKVTCTPDKTDHIFHTSWEHQNA